MNYLGRLLGIALFVLATVHSTQAQANKTEALDLRQFVGKSQFDRLNVPWLIPGGEHVADGVPFRIDGIIELYGKSALQKELNVRTNVSGISVNRAFEELHLLCATTGGSPTKDVAVANVHLRYADGTSNTLPILFGRHIRQWWGPRHEEDSALADPRSVPAWSMEMSEAAKSDKRSRFFHSVLENPAPDKVVTSLDLESAQSIAALMLAGMAVGTKNAPKLENTLPNQPPDADNLVRSGAPASLRGTIKTLDGAPLPHIAVRIMGVRGVKAVSAPILVDHPLVGTEVKSDSQGQFKFDNLPDDRLYQLIVIHDTFAPSVFYGADPLRGPIEMRLRPSQPLKASRKFWVHARVLDASDRPVIGAAVETSGVGTEQSTSWGSTSGFTETITDSKGEFIMERDEAFQRVQVRIQMAGLAPLKIWLHPSNAVQTVEMGVGATFIGRVVKAGKPVPNVQVEISGRERNMEVYAGSFTAKTDKDGRFTFHHVPPSTGWFLFGDIASLKEHGTVLPLAVQSRGDGTTNELPDITVVPGLTLAGKVETANSQVPLPKLSIYFSYDDVSQGTSTSCNPDGTFEFKGLHRGVVSISLGSSEWQLTPINRSLDEHNPWRLVGKLEANKTDLLLVIEKKPREYHSFGSNGHLRPEDQAEERDLYGAEPNGPAWLTFSGKILDEETGGVVASALITPGRKPPVMPKAPKPLAARLLEPFREPEVPWSERIFWEYGRKTRTTNGQFLIKLMPYAVSTPVLRIEADGYEAMDTDPLTVSTNLVVKLSRGVGPKGLVLLPGGKPAVGATVVYAQDGQQYSLQKDYQLYAYGQTNGLRKLGADGRFSFPALKGGRRLFITHSNGWANIPVSRMSSEEITLEPWATVQGTLVTTNGAPVADTPLAVTMWKGSIRGDPFVNFNERPKTDAKGRFSFFQLPPGELQLHRMQPSGPGGGYTYVYQTPIFAAPGKTNDLGKVTLDAPPPPTVFEELKKKIGL